MLDGNIFEKNIPIGYESAALRIHLTPSIDLPRTQVTPQFHRDKY